jgi:diguanylate cyclase (GGDEF)-like protein
VNRGAGALRIPVNKSNRLLPAIKNRPFVLVLVLVLALLAGVTGAFLEGQHLAQERVEATLDRGSVSLRNLLQRDLDNPLLVPEVLSTTPMVRSLLANPSPQAAAAQSELLEETARNTRVDVIYLMNLKGDCLAASNWRAADSFVGKNYGFRPYFQQALAGQTGRYIAKGVTSARIGYYLARAVTVGGEIRGVMVVKISFDTLQTRIDELWRRNKEFNILTDGNGVVVLAPVNAFTFKTMQALPEATRKAVEASRQYGADLLPMAQTMGASLTEHMRLVSFPDLPDQNFLQKAYDFPELGLRLYQHVEAPLYWRMVAELTAMFSLLALSAFLLCINLYQRRIYTAKLIEAAIHDPLTGLHTRLYMGDWCSGAIRAHQRDPQHGFGVVVFDLDFFKRVNDQHGHLVGDEVLRGVGKIIQSAIRGKDLAVRFGGEGLAVRFSGEELAVFVACADPAVVTALAERIRHRVEKFAFAGKASQISITVSGGVAFHQVKETIDDVFMRAGAKLREAKELGRNRIRA